MNKKLSNEDIIKMSPSIQELNLLSKAITEVKRNREYTEEFEQEVREVVDSIHNHKILHPKGKLADRKVPKRMSHDWSDEMLEDEAFSDLHKILVRCEKIVLISISEEIEKLRSSIKTTTTPKTTVVAGIFSNSTKNEKLQDSLRKPSKEGFQSKETLAQVSKSENLQNQKEVAKIDEYIEFSKEYISKLEKLEKEKYNEELVNYFAEKSMSLQRILMKFGRGIMTYQAPFSQIIDNNFQPIGNFPILLQSNIPKDALDFIPSIKSILYEFTDYLTEIKENPPTESINQQQNTETKSNKEKTYPVNLLITRFDVSQEELIRILLAFFVGFIAGLSLGLRF